MSPPRTYGELRRHWLQRVAPGADLPTPWEDTLPHVLAAARDQLLAALRNPEQDLEPPLLAAPPLDVAPMIGSQAACRAIAEVAGMATVGLPAALAAHLDRVARQDRAPDVRASARSALEASALSVSRGERDSP